MPPYPRSHASLWITLAPVMPPMLPIASPELPLCAACVEYLSDADGGVDGGVV